MHSVCVLRGRRNTLEACRNSRVGVSWQAQHFALLHPASIFVAGAAFSHVGKKLFCGIATAGLRKRDTVSNLLAGAAFFVNMS